MGVSAIPRLSIRLLSLTIPTCRLRLRVPTLSLSYVTRDVALPWRIAFSPHRLLIAEFSEEVSPLLPSPCHHQDHARSMFAVKPGSEGCPPEVCADEVGGENEGEVCYVRSTM